MRYELLDGSELMQYQVPALRGQSDMRGSVTMLPEDVSFDGMGGGFGGYGGGYGIPGMTPYSFGDYGLDFGGGYLTPAVVPNVEAPAPTPDYGAEFLSSVDASPEMQMGWDEYDLAMLDSQEAYDAMMAEANMAAAGRAGLSEREYAAMLGLGDRAESLAGTRFADLRGMSEEERQIMQGLADQELAAWEANAGVARDRAVDQMFSRGGVTGMVGQTRRGVAQVEQDFARDRAQRAAELNTGVQQGYFSRMYPAVQGYYDELGRVQQGYYAPATQGYFQNQGAAQDQYYSQRGALTNQRASSRSAARGGLTSARRGAYDARMGYLQGASNTGFNAASGIASAGQTFANNAGAAGVRGAEARASGQIASANAWGRGLERAAGAVADAWGQRPPRDSSKASKSPYRTPDYNPWDY